MLRGAFAWPPILPNVAGALTFARGRPENYPIQNIEEFGAKLNPMRFVQGEVLKDTKSSFRSAKFRTSPSTGPEFPSVKGAGCEKALMSR